MSVLDLGITSRKEFKKQLKAATPEIKKLWKAHGLQDSNWFKLTQAGYSPKEVLDLSDDEIDALFQVGYQALQARVYKSAELTFTKLCQLDPFDPRFPFALAATLHLQSRFSEASRLYLLALGLDATNVETYVRLGECLFALKEHNEAQDVLMVAIALVDDGLGYQDLKSQAESLLAQVLVGQAES